VYAAIGRGAEGRTIADHPNLHRMTYPDLYGVRVPSIE
jgi:hypothetical protein